MFQTPLRKDANATRRLSAAHEFDQFSASSSVSCTCRLPSRSITLICVVFPFCDSYAIHCPSQEMLGKDEFSRSNVNCLGCPPARDSFQRFAGVPAEYTTSRSSGVT